MRTTRTRGLAFATLVVVCAGLFAAAPAPADPVSCGVLRDMSQGFKWCGAYWAIEDLPVDVYVNTGTLPPGISPNQFTDAVRGAVLAWDLPPGLIHIATPGPSCLAGGRILCFKGTTNSGKANDGKTVVAFGAVSSNHLGDTRRCYTGASCASSGTRLKDADVTIKLSGLPLPWHQASPAEVISGEILSLRVEYGCQQISCPPWYDLQSAVTHELGHVLGLDHVDGLINTTCAGDVGEWASDLTDVWNAMQTMYPCQWRGHTKNRTIDLGDLAGLITIYLSALLT